MISEGVQKACRRQRAWIRGRGDLQVTMDPADRSCAVVAGRVSGPTPAAVDPSPRLLLVEARLTPAGSGHSLSHCLSILLAADRSSRFPSIHKRFPLTSAVSEAYTQGVRCWDRGGIRKVRRLKR